MSLGEKIDGCFNMAGSEKAVCFKLFFFWFAFLGSYFLFTHVVCGQKLLSMSIERVLAFKTFLRCIVFIIPDLILIFKSQNSFNGQQFLSAKSRWAVPVPEPRGHLFHLPPPPLLYRYCTPRAYDTWLCCCWCLYVFPSLNPSGAGKTDTATLVNKNAEASRPAIGSKWH